MDILRNVPMLQLYKSGYWKKSYRPTKSLLTPKLWIDLKKVNFGLNSILPLNILYELLDIIYF